MIGANLRAPNAITKNALSRLTSYEGITAALAELRNSLGFDSWNGLIALHVRPSSCSILTVIGSSAAQWSEDVPEGIGNRDGSLLPFIGATYAVDCELLRSFGVVSWRLVLARSC